MDIAMCYDFAEEIINREFIKELNDNYILQNKVRISIIFTEQDDDLKWTLTTYELNLQNKKHQMYIITTSRFDIEKNKLDYYRTCEIYKEETFTILTILQKQMRFIPIIPIKFLIRKNNYVFVFRNEIYGNLYEYPILK